MNASAVCKKSGLPIRLRAGVGLIVSLLCCTAVQAATPVIEQRWPRKPVRLVVPFGAGGMPDILTRVIAERLTRNNAQTFLVDNRPGAGGNTGAGLIARANPDGYQFLVTPGSVLTMNPSLYTHMPFDAASFSPVSLLAEMPILLVVHANNPAKNITEYISSAKRDPGKLVFSSPGSGSSLHLAIEIFQRSTGVAIQHISYKSGGEAMMAVLSGQATGSFTTPPVAISQVKAGTLRALGVTGITRSAQLPGVPTIAEAGIPGLDFSPWFGIVAPANTPQSVIVAMSSQIAMALREPDVQQRFSELGVRSIGSSPEEFAAFLRQDRAKWNDVIRVAGIRLD